MQKIVEQFLIISQGENTVFFFQIPNWRESLNLFFMVSSFKDSNQTKMLAGRTKMWQSEQKCWRANNNVVGETKIIGRANKNVGKRKKMLAEINKLLSR